MTWPIIGHEQLVADLQTAVRTRQPAHAYLLTGVPQLGKRTVAECFAAALLCDRPDGPCGECAQCRLRQAGNHPDLWKIGREDPLGIDDVRKLKGWLTMRPHSAPFRMALVVEVARLTAPGQNALLKLLEEPPPRTVIVLTAAAASDVLPTVVSRCRHLRLAVVPGEVLAAALTVSVSDAVEIIQLAEGRPGLARDLSEHPERLAEVRQWGITLKELLDALADRRLKIAKELADNPSLIAVFSHWIGLHRQALEAETVGEAPPRSMSDVAQSLSRQLTAGQLTANLQVLVAASAALRYNPNVLLLVETTLLKLGE